MVDLAVGVIIGAAFGKIVSSLVGDIFMPTLGKVIGGINFSDLAVTLGKDPTGKEVLIKYGSFLQTIFDFIIIALVLFLVIKGINQLKKPLLPRPRRPRRRPSRKSFSRKFATCSRSALARIRATIRRRPSSRSIPAQE